MIVYGMANRIERVKVSYYDFWRERFYVLDVVMLILKYCYRRIFYYSNYKDMKIS